MKRNTRSMVLGALSTLVLAACAGSGTPEDDPSGSGGDNSSGNGNTTTSGVTGSSSAAGTGGTGTGTTSSSSGGVGGAGTGGGGIGGTAGPNETPYFTTPELLCNYVNQARMTSSGHERWRGLPWSGQGHTMFYWPITFTVDQTLMDAAQAEADALAAGASPQGSPHSDGFLHKAIYVDGVDTANYMITSQQVTGDWIPGSFKAGLINANGTARQALYYHDTGGAMWGPKLNKVGCGGTYSQSDGSTWWVIKLAP